MRPALLSAPAAALGAFLMASGAQAEETQAPPAPLENVYEYKGELCRSPHVSSKNADDVRDIKAAMDGSPVWRLFLRQFLALSKPDQAESLMQSWAMCAVENFSQPRFSFRMYQGDDFEIALNIDGMQRIAPGISIYAQPQSKDFQDPGLQVSLVNEMAKIFFHQDDPGKFVYRDATRRIEDQVALLATSLAYINSITLLEACHVAHATGNQKIVQPVLEKTYPPIQALSGDCLKLAAGGSDVMTDDNMQDFIKKGMNAYLSDPGMIAMLAGLLYQQLSKSDSPPQELRTRAMPLEEYRAYLKRFDLSYAAEDLLASYQKGLGGMKKKVEPVKGLSL